MAKAPPEEAKLVKAERKEALARSVVETPAGQRRLVGIIQFFTQAHRQPHERFCVYCSGVGSVALAAIVELHVMHLPEHRNGVAGAIRGLIQLAERRGCPIFGWLPSVYQPLIDSSRKMEPSPIDSSITLPGNVDYLWMQWLVCRDPAIITRLGVLARRTDAVGQQALQVFFINGQMPEVVKALQQMHEQTLREATPSGTPTSYVPTVSIHALRRHITADPMARQLVVWIGWDPGKAIVLSTRDGLLPAGIPATWDGHKVQTRQATDQELEAAAKARELAEEP
jgi:hypothetical protein